VNLTAAVEPAVIRTRHVVLAVLFVCFAVADSLVMHVWLAMGAGELNPIVAYLLQIDEMGFWCLKGLVAVGSVVFFVLLSRKYPAQMGRILTGITVLIGLDLIYDLSGLIYTSMI
jgi:hypothetical protein